VLTKVRKQVTPALNTPPANILADLGVTPSPAKAMTGIEIESVREDLNIKFQSTLNSKNTAKNDKITPSKSPGFGGKGKAKVDQSGLPTGAPNDQN
jgi:hypothetical protein